MKKRLIQILPQNFQATIFDADVISYMMESPGAVPTTHAPLRRHWLSDY